jgi:hypothetical protein
MGLGAVLCFPPLPNSITFAFRWLYSFRTFHHHADALSLVACYRVIIR